MTTRRFEDQACDALLSFEGATLVNRAAIRDRMPLTNMPTPKLDATKIRRRAQGKKHASDGDMGTQALKKVLKSLDAVGALQRVDGAVVVTDWVRVREFRRALTLIGH